MVVVVTVGWDSQGKAKQIQGRSSSGSGSDAEMSV